MVAGHPPYSDKDGLVYTGKNKTDANYSRFSRPGAKRLFVTVSESRDHFPVSAWKNRNHHILVMSNGSDQPLRAQVFVCWFTRPNTPSNP